jgi:tRNA 2-thiocytidine biosynthesis protein TtcA
MFNSLQHVAPSHLLDHNLFDFKGLQTTGMPDPDGDTAFDKEAFATPSLPGIQTVTLNG